MFELRSKKESYGIKVPTSRKEVTKEIVDNILNDVKLAKHYFVLGLINVENPFRLLASANSKNKNSVSTVIPFIAKISEDDAKESGFKQMSNVIVDRSDIERGSHLFLSNNSISPTAVMNYIATDPAMSKAILSYNFSEYNGRTKDAEHPDDSYVSWYLLSFKVMPINDIKATIEPSNLKNILLFDKPRAEEDSKES